MSENDNARFMPGDKESGRYRQNNVDFDSQDAVTDCSTGHDEVIPKDTLPYFKQKAEREAVRKSVDSCGIDSEAGGTKESAESEDDSEGKADVPTVKDSRHTVLRLGLWLAIGLPVIAVVCLALGVAIGSKRGLVHPFMSQQERDIQLVSQTIAAKIGPAIYTVQTEYVDELPLDTIIEMAIDGMMSSLDPHSLYIAEKDLDKVNEELAGEFSGVGVSFILYNDTIAVVDAIKGGPAYNVGIEKGDRILAADGKSLTGKDVTSDTVFKTLRGKQGSKVTLKVKRQQSGKIQEISVTRGAVPVNSVEAAYMLDDEKTGYIKISSFTSNTYNEAYTALGQLRNAGATDFIIDLRGNPGGFMDQAILLANEFLPSGRGIVYTKARRPENEMNVKADGTGAFQNSRIAVVIDENSASASEIFAGAMQDNDRGVIVGRRSFGKGLVQNQFDNVGGGALRLTVARYYTPSGRSIQKEYSLGSRDSYSEDLLSRYSHGELFNADSIKLDKSKLFKTVGGRSVYGGGGIMPDIFVPEDTSSYTPYYVKAMNSGLIMNFAFKIADAYRPLLRNVTNERQLYHIIPDDSRLLNAFTEYGERNGLPAAWYYVNLSADMIVNKIKAFIARDILNDNCFYKMFNIDDTTLLRAREALEDKKLPDEPEMR